MESQLRTRTRRVGGFSFIEILVVMSIIAVLTSMVVVMVPMILEQGRITQSKDNVRTIITFMIARRTSRSNAGWPPYNGKNFVLDVVATGQLDARNPQNLEVLFSPGDVLCRLDLVDEAEWANVTPKALKNGLDCSRLTSYAGRSNAERHGLITPDQEKRGVMILCDDDEGPLHHPAGIVAGYSNGGARFLEWADLDLGVPADPDDPDPFLGDAAENDELARMWGR